MKEHEDTCVAVVDKYTFYGANRFTLMKHKHKRHMHELHMKRYCWCKIFVSTLRTKFNSFTRLLFHSRLTQIRGFAYL